MEDGGLARCHLRSWSWKVMASPMSSSPDTLSSMSTVIWEGSRRVSG